MTWVMVACVAGATLTMKVLGPVIAGGRRPGAAVLRVIALSTPALITSLVVTATVTSGSGLVVDARVAGLALGVVLLAARAPLPVVLAGAALLTALVRLVS